MLQKIFKNVCFWLIHISTHINCYSLINGNGISCLFKYSLKCGLYIRVYKLFYYAKCIYTHSRPNTIHTNTLCNANKSYNWQPLNNSVSNFLNLFKIV